MSVCISPTLTWFDYPMIYAAVTLVQTYFSKTGALAQNGSAWILEERAIPRRYNCIRVVACKEKELMAGTQEPNALRVRKIPQTREQIVDARQWSSWQIDGSQNSFDDAGYCCRLHSFHCHHCGGVFRGITLQEFGAVSSPKSWRLVPWDTLLPRWQWKPWWLWRYPESLRLYGVHRSARYHCLPIVNLLCSLFLRKLPGCESISVMDTCPGLLLLV